jgi:hypothetical protein
MRLWTHLKSSRKARLHGAALLFFALVALITLYPLVFHAQTRGAGYDYFFPHWTFWWTRHALTTEGLNVYESNYVMAPFTSSYALNALTVFWFPVWAALEPLIGTMAAVTVIIALACTLNGYLLFAWLLDEDVSPGLALIGGVALQIFPITRYFYYNTHINLMDWFWLPANLLLWKRIAAAAETGRARRVVALALAQGLMWWAVALTDLQAPIFVAFILGPYGLLTFSRSRRRGRLIAAGALAAVVAVALLWWIGPLRYILDFDDQLIPGPVEDRPVIAFPDGLIGMSKTWWDWSTPSLGAFVTLVALVSLLWAILKAPHFRRDCWFWLSVAIPPLAIAIGPTLRIGDTDIALPPFRALYDLTDGNYRMPWRMAPVFVIAVLTFAGKVWSPGKSIPDRVHLFVGAGLQTRPYPGKQAIPVLFFLLALSFRLYEAGPVRSVLPAYHTYTLMGQERGDYVVLEVPTGAGTGEVLLGDPEAIAFQYYGITHGKRMVNGFISRAPLAHFWYLHTDDPMLSWLGQRRALEAERVTEQLRERITEWPIGYIVVHQDYVRRNGAQPLEITGFLNSLDDLLCPPMVEGDAVFYRTTWHPDGCALRTPPESDPGVYTLDIGAPGDERYLGWGWHWQETVAGLTLRWAGDQPQATLYVDLPPGDYRVTVSMQAFSAPRQARLIVNGTPLDAGMTVSEASLQAYTFDLPAALVGDGIHLVLALDYDSWLVPAEIGQSADQRRLSVAADWIQFRREE